MGSNFSINYRRVLFFTTLFLIISLLSVAVSQADPDLWHRLAVGKIFSELGSVIYHDIFSYFPRKDLWVDHEWLSGVVFYYLTRFFGDFGVIGLQILSIFSVVLLIYKTHRLYYQEKNQYRIGFYFIVILSIYFGMASDIRSQIFTYLFFTLWIYVLERIRINNENRLVWIFPATMLFWANMHGGFLAGIGLLCFYALGEFLNGNSFKKFVLIILSVIPVTLINPYGLDYWSYMYSAVTMDRHFITEWGALNPFESLFAGIALKLLLPLLIVGYLNKIIKKDYNFDKVELIALVVTLYMTFSHKRHIEFFAIVAAVFAYRHFIVVLKEVTYKFGFLNRIKNKNRYYFIKDTVIYLPLVFFMVYYLATSSAVVRLESYPTKAVEFIKKNNLSGNLFVHFNWGSYALWKLYPQCLVSMDGRFEETYQTKSYMDNCEFFFAFADWKDILAKYHHDIILLDKNSKIYNLMKSNKKWQIVYEDEKAAVLLPLKAENRKWVSPDSDENYYIKNKYETKISF